jgi:hypothetical protein
MICPQIGPDVLDRVQLWRIERERYDGNFAWDAQSAGTMSAGVVYHYHGVGAWPNGFRDFIQMGVHGGGVGPRHNQCRSRGARWQTAPKM